MPFSTFQDLSIDILHVKIRPFLRILKKCILLLKKVRFPSFFLYIRVLWIVVEEAGGVEKKKLNLENVKKNDGKEDIIS